MLKKGVSFVGLSSQTTWRISSLWFVASVFHVASSITTVRLRLVDGFASNEGRVEVFYDGKWGTICDDKFHMSDANVICRQMGFAGAEQYHHNSFFGPGQGVIWLDELGCFGMETDVSSCRHSGWGIHNCNKGHSEDASVVCRTTESIGRIRLTDGDSKKMGRLEVWYNDTWGTVCEQNFTLTEANVVCRQLGTSAAASLRGFKPTSGSVDVPVWLDWVRCNGNESSITHCNYSSFGMSSCHYSQSVGIVCDDDSGPPDGTIKLVDGTDPPRDGRVLIYHNHQWGTVCNHEWNLLDSKVVCHQLGFSPPSQTFTGGIAVPAKETTAKWIMGQVQCSGTELRLTDCSHPGFGKANCTGSSGDVSVRCGDPLIPNDIRLFNGTSPNNGLLKALFNGTWLPVCKADFDTEINNVICRQLGYTRFHNFTTQIGNISNEKVGTYALCTGNEKKLGDCTSHAWFIEPPYNTGGRFIIPNSCYHNSEYKMICADEPDAIPELTTPLSVGIRGSCRPHNTYQTYSVRGCRVFTPKHPSTYDLDLICTWSVTVPNSQPNLTIAVDAFSTENFRDKLEVFDGWSERHPKLVTWSGEVSVGTNVTTTGRSIFLKFTSDHAYSKSGFKVHCLSSAPPFGPSSSTTSTSTESPSSAAVPGGVTSTMPSSSATSMTKDSSSAGAPVRVISTGSSMQASSTISSIKESPSAGAPVRVISTGSSMQASSTISSIKESPSTGAPVRVISTGSSMHASSTISSIKAMSSTRTLPPPRTPPSPASSSPGSATASYVTIVLCAWMPMFAALA